MVILGLISSPISLTLKIMSTVDLFDACWKGDIARVRQAFSDQIDVRKVVNKNFFNYTLLHYACRYVACETKTFYAYLSDYDDICT